MTTLAVPGRYRPVGYQQIVGLAAATALTVPDAGASVARIDVEAQAVRYRDDGTDPTSTVGQPIAAGAGIFYTGNLNALKLIQQAVAATVNVTYYADSRFGA